MVTRNYRDFAPLVEAYGRQARASPGVLFYASSVRRSDVGHHVRALLDWVHSASETGVNPVQNGLGWLR